MMTTVEPRQRYNTPNPEKEVEQLSDKNTLTENKYSFFKALKLAYKIFHTDDVWEYSEEPHTSRRQEILSKHPEIKDLMGYDPTIAYIVVLEVIIQLAICQVISVYQPSWLIVVIAAYVIGATLNHSLGSSIHEIGHNLAFGHRYPIANRILSLVSNLPIVVPMAISYKKYHHEHHRWLGHEVKDVDIPLRIEAKLFQSPASRLLWLFLHPFIHSVRPFFKSPKPITLWEIINVCVQFCFDLIVLKVFGSTSFAYLCLGTIFGFGPHPMAGHFISEHYLFSDNHATHSYYGSFNPLLFNVGYHVEHHDFPYIPHTRLHKLKAIAPEYYDHLPYHTSMWWVLYSFVMHPDNGPQGRSITSENKNHPEMYTNAVTTFKS